jgi:competence protein ComEA
MKTFFSAILTAALLVLAPLVSADPLDINTATETQFDEVMKGVGKTKAKAIVDDREKNGKFASVDDLARVKGIGPATVEKNRNLLVAATADGAPGKAKAQTPPVPAKVP